MTDGPSILVAGCLLCAGSYAGSWGLACLIPPPVTPASVFFFFFFLFFFFFYDANMQSNHLFTKPVDRQLLQAPDPSPTAALAGHEPGESRLSTAT